MSRITTEIQELVEAWLKAKTQANLDALYAVLMPYVRSLASRITNVVPNLVDLDDLVQDAAIAALASLYSYDVSKGIKFTSYAHTRIEGAMKDTVRRMNPSSRTRNVKNESLERLDLDPASVILRHTNFDRPLLAFHRAILQLPSLEKMIFLFVFNGFRHHTVARLLDMPLTEVRSVMANARSILTEELAASSSSSFEESIS